jgi:hypothetical protein
MNDEDVLGPYIPPGAKVRYDGGGQPEYGVVVHCWIDEQIRAYDCYVVFFGDEFPAGPPKCIPYVLRYSAMSLTVVDRAPLDT